MSSTVLAVLTLWCAVVAVRAEAPGGPQVVAVNALCRSAVRYSCESTVLLNDVQHRDREVGYKLRAQLAVAPAAIDAAGDELLLQFHLSQLQLYLKGKHINAEYLPHSSVLDKQGESTFYAHWKKGVIQTAYLDSEEPLDIQNYKRSLISLFQLQTVEGEFNETDVSGSCRVLYEAVSEHVFRKTKVACEGDGAGLWARRVARYSTAAGALGDVHAEDVLALGHDQLGVKARSWVALRPLGPGPAPPAAGADVRAAVRALPEALRPAALALALRASEAAPGAPDDEYEALEAAALGAAAALGERPAAGAALRLLPALRAASAAALARLMRADALHPLLGGLSRLVGASGTEAGLAAAADVLQLRAEDPVLPHALLYLEGLALAPAPAARALADALRLADAARHPHVAEAALLAVAAAAPAAGADAAAAVREALGRALHRCADPECRRVRLAALGNMRRADTVDLLLAHAERADPPESRLAALQALAAAPPAALGVARLQRLAHLALHGAGPLDVRAAALDLLAVRSAPSPVRLVAVARELHARGPQELRRLFWRRLRELARTHLPVRQFFKVMDPELRGWDAQAPAGTSDVVERPAGWAAAGWTAVLESVQLAERGLLRRGRVRLALAGPDNATVELLGVEVWTRGLAALAGGGGGGDGGAEAGQEEEVAGGLALSVGGARLRGVTLFASQAELLGHVWAGAGSAPTGVARALVAAREAGGAAALAAGAPVRYWRRGAAALALDAQAQVSLWWRTARCRLDLAVSAAAAAQATVRTAWAELGARVELETEPRLRVATDVDFYETVAVCVRVSADPHELARNVSLWGELGALRPRRWRASRTPAAGATLSLGARSDRACRTLRAADADED